MALIVEHWTDLPEAVRAGIVAMVRASAPAPTHRRAAHPSRMDADAD